MNKHFFTRFELTRNLCRVAALAITVTFAACQPLGINSFSVTPKNVCRSQPVNSALATARWDTTGSLTYLRISGDEGTSSLGISTTGGNGLYGQGFHLLSEVTWTLEAVRDSASVTDSKTINIKDGDALNKSGQVTCDGTARFAIGGDEYSEPNPDDATDIFFRVTHITNRSTQRIGITHLSITRELEPNETVTAAEFGVVQLTREWIVTTAVPPGACTRDPVDPRPPPPLPQVSLDIQTLCDSR